jgi:hypothetical protein
MTRKEAIEKWSNRPFGTSEYVIDFFIETGMLKVEEESLELRVVKALRLSGYSGSAVMCELDRAGLKIVEK